MEAIPFILCLLCTAVSSISSIIPGLIKTPSLPVRFIIKWNTTPCDKVLLPISNVGGFDMLILNYHTYCVLPYIQKIHALDDLYSSLVKESHCVSWVSKPILVTRRDQCGVTYLSVCTAMCWHGFDFFCWISQCLIAGLCLKLSLLYQRIYWRGWLSWNAGAPGGSEPHHKEGKHDNKPISNFEINLMVIRLSSKKYIRTITCWAKW